MKRSQMLEELAWYYETDEMDNPHDAIINANRVLRLIESLGMLPPAYNNKNSGINENYLTLAWEPEDDE